MILFHMRKNKKIAIKVLEKRVSIKKNNYIDNTISMYIFIINATIYYVLKLKKKNLNSPIISNSLLHT